jgi:uncharacterized delta-60 repeat protein
MTNQPGTPDHEYGDNEGVLFWTIPEFASIAPQAIVPLPHDKLIVVANEPGYPRGFVVARLTDKGQLDTGTGFGDGGQGFVRISIPETHLQYIVAASILNDGGCLVTVDYSRRSPDENGFLVVRLDENGRINKTFGQDGIAFFPYEALTATLNRMAMIESAGQKEGLVFMSGVQGANSGMSAIELPDGKICLVGIGFDPATQQTKGWVRRLNPDGSSDITFNKIGRATVELGDKGDNAARGVAPHTNGGLVVFGDFDDAGIFGAYAVRFNQDGTRDEKFSTVVLSSKEMPFFHDIAVRKKDGIIVLAGSQNAERIMDGVGMIVVLTAGGSFHPLFNNGAPLFEKVLPEIGQRWTRCVFGGIDEDKLIVSGTSGNVFLLDDTHVVCARYLLTGELDTSFNGGCYFVDTPDRLEVAVDMAITDQGKVVICGELHKDRLNLPNGGFIARHFA